MDNPWHTAKPGARSNIMMDSDESIVEERARQPSTAQLRLENQGDELPTDAKKAAEIYQGTGGMVDLGRVAAEPDYTAGDITLNFQDTEISEVVKTILGDILRVNYVLDEGVRGTAYLQTSSPLSRDALIPTLEKLLQINGAVMIKSDSLYEVVPADSPAAAALAPNSTLLAGKGYQLLIMPLRYIAAQEMLKILEPLKPQKGIMEADSRRNLLSVAGTQEELNNIRETVRMFDIDQLRGMSVGLFRLQSVEAAVIMEELEAIFGDTSEGPLAGLVRFIPIERLNALLVLTPQAKYLSDARIWIERLDRTEDAHGLNMFVYYVQNGKAENLAEMLAELFDVQERSRRREERSNESGSTRQANRDDSSAPEEQPDDGEQQRESPTTTKVTVGGAALDGASLDVGEVSIIADEENNALLILASPGDYRKVHSAILKLDVLPLQVLVEATIVEVTLEDELQYGLQWFFKTHLDNKTGRGTVGSFPIVPPGDFGSSASFELFNSAGTRLLLSALAADSRLNVVSSPSLMVLDNHTATIRVGDQVPVRTSETVNTGSDALNQTSTIQFKDTGVLLEVTPRVNSGGMVVLDIKQEVNDVAETTTSGIDSPTITQRLIDTSVAVQSGETLVLGGLIRENKTRDSEGVPGLRHVPVVGWLFGSEGKSVKRTELVVLITPTAVTDREEARDVTREYRNKLEGVQFPVGPASKTSGS
ncbi:type II secretion system secretin GspD [Marinobacterium sp. CAU 1594]|nr:type II secretion system secretin GspD [Marinobacterium arenosum]